jgi:hypothetical protein
VWPFLRSSHIYFAAPYFLLQWQNNPPLLADTLDRIRCQLLSSNVDAQILDINQFILGEVSVLANSEALASLYQELAMPIGLVHMTMSIIKSQNSSQEWRLIHTHRLAKEARKGN